MGRKIRGRCIDTSRPTHGSDVSLTHVAPIGPPVYWSPNIRTELIRGISNSASRYPRMLFGSSRPESELRMSPETGGVVSNSFPGLFYLKNEREPPRGRIVRK